MKLRRAAKLVVAVLAVGVGATAGQAGLYQDDLSRCLGSAAKPEDRTMLLRWVFAAMASNPKIKDMSQVSADQAKSLSVNAAGLMQRLMLTDCHRQTVEAIKYEGAGAIQQAFGTLGQIAMADLMREDASNAYMSDLTNHLDKPQWEALMAEAGVKAPAQK